MIRKAVFFDRDGIVNERFIDNYVLDFSQFVFKDNIFNLIAAVKKSDYLAILITNQQCIGKGLLSEEQLNDIHLSMQNTIYAKTGYKFDGIYYCGDLKDDNSFRRKPMPGMIYESALEHNISMNGSFIIGDTITDIDAGIYAGLKTIYINSDFCKKADYSFNSLSRAVYFFNYILTNNA